MVHDEPSRLEKLHPILLWKKFDPKLKTLLFSDILIRFCEQIPYVFVVIWCLNIIKTTPEQFGILTAIEMIVSVLIYIPVAHFSDKLERKPFVLITFVFFAVFPLILYFSTSFPLLIFAFVIRGLKEFGEPTRKAMILDLSVKDAEARCFGLYYFIRDFIVSFAAFAGGWLWSISAEVNLFTAFIFGIIGTVYFGIFGWRTNRFSN
jgi:MFS family permease